MSDGRCQTCKWWGAQAQPEEGWGVCNYAAEETADKPLPLHRAAVVVTETENYWGYLATQAGFGCVQHEPRET